LAALIGGYQHVVPSTAMANSCRRFVVFDEPQSYSLGQFKHHHRANIKKGLKHFTIKEVSLQEFINQGYPVYLSFYARTKYSFKEDRRDEVRFAGWAKTVYAYPKILVLGAWLEDKLAAVHISYHVEDIVMLATFFCTTDALRLRVSDVVMHALRERAALCPDVTCLYMGTVSGQTGIDDFKLGRGAKIVSKPAFYSVNRIVLPVIKTFMRPSYQRLIGAECGRRRGWDAIRAVDIGSGSFSFIVDLRMQMERMDVGRELFVFE
jgi:hypothetical protein